MNATWIAIIVILPAAIGFALLCRYVTAKSCLKAWAIENHYRVISFRYTRIPLGPSRFDVKFIDNENVEHEVHVSFDCILWKRITAVSESER